MAAWPRCGTSGSPTIIPRLHIRLGTRQGHVHSSYGLVVTALGPDDRHVRWHVKARKKDADIGTSLDSPANQVSGVNGAPQVRPAQRDAKHR